MMIVKILNQPLNEKHPQTTHFAIGERFAEIEAAILGHIEIPRVGIDKMNNDLVVVHAHPHLNILRACRIVFYHVRKKFFNRKIQYISDLIIDAMSKGKFVGEIEYPVERFYRSCKVLFHCLRVHACKFSRFS